MTIDESWYVRPASGIKERTSAGGIIVRWDAEQKKIYLALTTGEASKDDPSQESVAYILPKGGVDPGESVEEAARREIAEEAGFFALTQIAALGSRSRLSWDKRRWITTHYFLYTTEETNPQPTDPNYAYVTHWFDITVGDASLPPIFWPEQKALIVETLPKIRELLPAVGVG
jgi:8-oxo-dGTP pyrophosphatase MutT (NUDIX family)